MKKLLLLLALSFGHIVAQTPFIGHAVFTFNDSTRTGGFGSGGGPGRQIQCEVYYPSTSSTGGDNVPLAPGQYPVLVFGHGFVMVWSSYENIWTDLVPQGYVMAFVRTEGSFSPVHADFGLDLALVADRMVKEGNNPTCFLYNNLTNRSAIMGHSMGGGSSFLACAGNTAVTTMVTFAAANTNPSSIAAANNVSMPTLVIAGQNDCVAPPAAHQDSMYLKTAASCKAEITIKGAAHCEFANTNANCMFGQGTCSPQPTISSATQKTIASLYYSNWLAWFLKDDCNAWTTFNDSAGLNTAVIANRSCSITCAAGVSELHKMEGLTIYPNPANSSFTISLTLNEPVLSIEIFDGPGRSVKKIDRISAGESIDILSLEKGMYFVRVLTRQGIYEKVLVRS